MRELENEVIIYDTEYTTWEGAMERDWRGENEYREMVQIGAIKVDTNTWTETDHLLLFIKPIKNPILSEYFKNLTGISQDIVDARGVSYEKALERFKKWSGVIPCYSWGRDADFMRENATLIGIRFPFAEDALRDIRPHFAERGIQTENYSSGTIPEAFGATPPPHAHDALNDARSILLGLRLLHAK